MRDGSFGISFGICQDAEKVSAADSQKSLI
jgi:hypothetical protein